MAVGGITPPDRGMAHWTTLAARLGFLNLAKNIVDAAVMKEDDARNIKREAAKYAGWAI
jgi:hypothetical protein